MPNVYDVVASMTQTGGVPGTASTKENSGSSDGGGADAGDDRAAMAAGLGENTAIADYVWLPIRFADEHPVIDWHDEWRVEDYD
jgi:hypothetical protein